MDKHTCADCGHRFAGTSQYNRHRRQVLCRPVDRFWAKVDKDGPIPEYRPDLGPCWLWHGEITDRGYGRFMEGHRGKHHSAHRYAWELVNGPMPAHLQADHLCRVPACVRPSHVEPVTPSENQRRIPGSNATKTHCKHGHEFSPENTIVYGNGRKRGCRTCGRINSRASYLRRRVG